MGRSPFLWLLSLEEFRSEHDSRNRPVKVACDVFSHCYYGENLEAPQGWRPFSTLDRDSYLPPTSKPGKEPEETAGFGRAVQLGKRERNLGISESRTPVPLLVQTIIWKRSPRSPVISDLDSSGPLGNGQAEGQTRCLSLPECRPVSSGPRVSRVLL